jgi:hypothetical protein
MSEKCPQSIYILMLECWNLDPHYRFRPQATLRDIHQLLYQGILILNFLKNERKKREETHVNLQAKNEGQKINTLLDISSKSPPNRKT